jgi:hypothetical protein
MPPSTTTNCPYCGRKLSSVHSLSRHLSQKHSYCSIQRANGVYSGQEAGSSTSTTATLDSQSFPFSGLGNSLPDMDIDIEFANGEDDLDLDLLGEVLSSVQQENSIPGPSNAAPNGGQRTQAFYREDFPGSAAEDYGSGSTFIQQFAEDQYAQERKDSANVYHPFASRADWELGQFLLFSRMSMSLINQFLKLELVRSSLPNLMYY